MKIFLRVLMILFLFIVIFIVVKSDMLSFKNNKGVDLETLKQSNDQNNDENFLEDSVNQKSEISINNQITEVNSTSSDNGKNGVIILGGDGILNN